MYDLLMMIKPGATFTSEEMHSVVSEVAKTGSRRLRASGGSIILEAGNGYLKVGFNDAPHVVEEAREIADTFGINCAGSKARFEMSGHDPDMKLMNDQILICERLDQTGRFVLFDSVDGALFGQ